LVRTTSTSPRSVSRSSEITSSAKGEGHERVPPGPGFCDCLFALTDAPGGFLGGAGLIRPATGSGGILAREAGMFGSLGVPELMMIFVVALLLFGPKNLPKIGRTLGRAMAEFRRASNDFKRTIEEEVAASEIRDVKREIDEAARGRSPEGGDGDGAGG